MRQKENVKYFGMEKRSIFSMPIHITEVEPTMAMNQDKYVPFSASYLKLCSSLFILPFRVEFNNIEGTWNSQKSKKRIVSIHISMNL